MISKEEEEEEVEDLQMDVREETLNSLSVGNGWECRVRGNGKSNLSSELGTEGVMQ